LGKLGVVVMFQGVMVEWLWGEVKSDGRFICWVGDGESYYQRKTTPSGFACHPSKGGDFL